MACVRFTSSFASVFSAGACSKRTDHDARDHVGCEPQRADDLWSRSRYPDRSNVRAIREARSKGALSMRTCSESTPAGRGKYELVVQEHVGVVQEHEVVLG